MPGPSAHVRGAAAGILLGLLLLSCIGTALAQRNIGLATAIVRDVSAQLGGNTRTLSAGNTIFANENISTDEASIAQLLFLDKTTLRIGPSASVVLDRFVFNPDKSVSEGVVNVLSGAARWVGGTSGPDTHQVQTPHAVIGVRGTIFDMLVESFRTIVTLREGVIEVCLVQNPQRCVTLDSPVQTVIVTATAIVGPRAGGTSSARFANMCLSPIQRAFCTFPPTTQFRRAGFAPKGMKQAKPRGMKRVKYRSMSQEVDYPTMRRSMRSMWYDDDYPTMRKMKKRMRHDDYPGMRMKKRMRQDDYPNMRKKMMKKSMRQDDYPGMRKKMMKKSMRQDDYPGMRKSMKGMQSMRGMGSMMGMGSMASMMGMGSMRGMGSMGSMMGMRGMGSMGSMKQERNRRSMSN